MEADISGPQRKVIASSVRPLRAQHGATGIAVRSGSTLPFAVARSWIAPAGYYPEQWFLVDPSTREVLYESPVRDGLIWGLQAATDLVDEVRAPVRLAPGSYQIVFALGGLKGGELAVEATEAPSEEAA